MKNKIIGIYCIENILNGKKYIGQSVDLERRMKLKHIDSPAINNSIKKYGRENFKSYILEECEKGKLNELEKYYIALMKSRTNEFGYNICLGGKSGMQDVERSEETREKIRKKHLGSKASEETKIKMRKSRKGNHTTIGKKLRTSRSPYYGVRKITVNKKYLYWVARFEVENKVVYLGNFKKEDDAAKSYDEYIIKNKIMRPLNFPKIKKE